MPPGRRPQDQNYPFTKRCTDAAITLIEPDRDWFTDRGLEFPRPKKERVEIFAAHAWAFASCDFHDAGAAAALPGTPFHPRSATSSSACAGTLFLDYARAPCS